MFRSAQSETGISLRQKHGSFYVLLKKVFTSPPPSLLTQWYAVCLSDIGDYEGVKVKIGNSYFIREHLEVRQHFAVPRFLFVYSELRHDVFLLVCVFSRKPSSSTPKMPPPYTF